MALKLKLLRLQTGLTLEELAQASGLTRSYVSRLERGVSNPSISSALKIAKALSVPVEELFSEGMGDDLVVINRRAASTDVSPHVVSGVLPGHQMVAFVINPSDEPVKNHPMSRHQGEEILYVLKGTISLRLARREETLHAGDSAHFNSAIPHKITSIGKQAASVLLVIAQTQ